MININDLFKILYYNIIKKMGYKCGKDNGEGSMVLYFNYNLKAMIDNRYLSY